MLATPSGRIAVGWLVMEDLVRVLVLLPPLAGMTGRSTPAADTPSLPATLLVTLCAPRAKWCCSSA